MTDYNAPLKDILFTLNELSGLDEVLSLPAFADFDSDIVGQVVEEAGKFASDILAPLNMPGDQTGSKLGDDGVISPTGFADAHKKFVENGWQGVDLGTEHGGMGMPSLVGIAAMETWQSACISFSLNPMLNNGAIHALSVHGTDVMREIYVPKMGTGEWTGTMNLTEPQAGSDLSVVATKAAPEGEHYRITGTKIFITWGDHDFGGNVIHLVLARLTGAAEGIRGLSLFLVPKFLVNDDGSLGERNDVVVSGLEHKLGIHASPTCVMSFGEQGGAIAYLIGEENKGLACMFSMMNHARLGVGVQGLAVSERAYQLARAFAMDRKQGTAPGVKGSATIVHHPDVRRMLLTMKSQIEAMRAVAYYATAVVDIASHSTDDKTKSLAVKRGALLTPIVKTWLTEVAQELTSLGVQVHGGMGFVEETGAAQHMRDARILPIYEGTTGIQALDFVGRKVMADEGRALTELVADIQSIDAVLAGDERLAEIRSALLEGVQKLDETKRWLLEQGPLDPNAPGAASVNMLMLAGIVVGGWRMASAGLAVVSADAKTDSAFNDAKLITIRFYAQHIMPRCSGLAAAATAGANSVMAMPEDSF